MKERALIWSGSLHECSSVHISTSCFLVYNLLWLLQGQSRGRVFTILASSAKSLLQNLKQRCSKKWAVVIMVMAGAWQIIAETQGLNDGIFILNLHPGVRPRCRLYWNFSSLLLVWPIRQNFMHCLSGFPDVFVDYYRQIGMPKTVGRLSKENKGWKRKEVLQLCLALCL